MFNLETPEGLYLLTYNFVHVLNIVVCYTEHME